MRKICIVLLVLSAVTFAGAQDIPKDYADAATYLGKTGDYKANVFKIGIPRNDLKIRVKDILLPTPFGFAGWVAMTKGDGGHDVLMGDLPLTESEVNPVMSALLDNGLEVTALHNHFFYMDPPLFFMHIHGHGTAMDLAHELKPALDLIGKDKQMGSDLIVAPPQGVVTGQIDTAALDKIVGATGDKNGDVYKYTVGRSDLHLTEMGAVINTRMGLNTWAAFFGSDADAVVAGDVAMLPSEVQDVLKILRSHSVEVVAIHQHMIDTNPQIIFLHYWGRGKAADLATAFRATLDQLGKK